MRGVCSHSVRRQQIGARVGESARTAAARAAAAAAPRLEAAGGQLAAAARELAAAAAAEVDTQVAPAIEAALKQGAEEVQRAAGLAGRTTSSHQPAVNRCSGRLRRRCLADDWPCLDGGPAAPPARRHAGLLLLLLRLEVPSTLLPASLRHDDGTTVLCDLTLAVLHPPPPPLLLLASAMDAHCRRAALHAARWGLPHASRDGGSLHIMYDDGTVYSTQNESSLVTSGVLHAARSANSPVAGVTVLGGNFGDGVSLASSRVTVSSPVSLA